MLSYQRRHQLLAFLLGLTLIALALQSVGCSASSRQRAIKSTLVAVDAARDGFTVWDERTQDAIVEAAQTKIDGREMLLAHREKRTPIVLGFNAVYRALALAALDPEEANVAIAATLAADLYETIKEITGRESPDREK
jgi:hypothetical protein